MRIAPAAVESAMKVQEPLIDRNVTEEELEEILAEQDLLELWNGRAESDG